MKNKTYLVWSFFYEVTVIANSAIEAKKIVGGENYKQYSTKLINN